MFLEEDHETWSKLLRSYAITYLKEEIQAEALTRNLRCLKSFASYYGKSHTPLVIYRGEHPAAIDGVEVLPVPMALTLLTSK
jgi:hypothetical protein